MNTQAPTMCCTADYPASLSTRPSGSRRSFHRRWPVFAAALLLAPAGCGRNPVKTASAGDDPNCAAVRVDRPGCPNLFKVTEDLYRGAQPGRAGFGELEKLGVRTVVNLRDTHSDRPAIDGTRLDYVPIPMEAWDPELDQMRQFLTVATDPNRLPVFVHCRHGADRTGAMVAVYRIVVQGWTKQQAIDEMTKGPYGFHPIWQELPRFVRDLDADKLRKDLNLPTPTRPAVGSR